MPYNGQPPFVAGSTTSAAAAESIAPTAGAIRERVLDMVRGCGVFGATCDEVEKLLDLRHQTASARLRELVLRGQIVDSKRQRETRSGRQAVVYVLPIYLGPVQPSNT